MEYMNDVCEILMRQFSLNLDQQIGQMYELMNSIREKELAENDPEYSLDPVSQKKDE
jgi:hypothetical protein